MSRIFLVMAFAICGLSSAEWKPPQNPNPDVILEEAGSDYRARRFETALAKYVWFHENSLSIEPSLYGVRLSFALGYWLDLAKVYPPAMDKLKAARDKAHNDVLAQKNVRESFHDMESINSYLGEVAKTQEVFEMMDQKMPALAKQVFDLAQPALVTGKAYQLLGKYLSPDNDFATIKNNYDFDKQLAADPEFGADHMDYANQAYMNESTTLVALLAVNDRVQEAQKVADLAKAEWNNESFHKAVDKALEGVVPEPWP